MQARADAAHAVEPDLIALCPGGPIAAPADAADVVPHTRGVAGFSGAPNMTWLLTAVAFTAQVRRFARMRATR